MLKETAEQKQKRIFEFYKQDLIKLAHTHENPTLRFNVIEYQCSFPDIDPFIMGAAIANCGIKILFDDTAIPAKENKRKERKLKSILTA